MSDIRDVLFVFALALGATLTVAWDGLLGYGLFRLVSTAFLSRPAYNNNLVRFRQLGDIGGDAPGFDCRRLFSAG
jgi:hypothetical protein